MLRQAARLHSLASRSQSLHNGKGRPSLSSLQQLSSRSISTRNTARPQLLQQSNTRCSISRLPKSYRFASTSSTINTEPANPDLSTLIPDSTGANAWDPNFHDILSPGQLADITPHIGFLQELGLNYGWGTTSLIQWILEHVYVYSELPWYAAFIITAYSVRLAMLPLFFRGADMSGRLSALQPITTPLMKQISAAKENGDQAEMLRLTRELTALRSRAKIRLSRVFMPMLIQIPLAFGAFRLARGMVDLPVPGLETGGVLWFTDLTSPDPYYLLPLTTSVLAYLSLRRGSEMGVATAEQQQLMGTLKYVFPVISLAFTSWMPVAVTLQFAATTSFGLMQTYILSSNRAREILGIHPLSHKLTEEETAAYTGTLTKSVDTTVNQPKKPSMYATMKKRVEDYTATKEKKSRLTNAEKRKADAYERRRRQELEDELQFRRRQLSRRSRGEDQE